MARCPQQGQQVQARRSIHWIRHQSTLYPRVDFFLGQQLQLLVRDQRSPELQLAVHAAGVIGSEDGLNGGEEAGRLSAKVSEDELKLGGVKFGKDKQGLAGACIRVKL